MGVEGKADDLHGVTLQSMVQLASVGVPDLGFFVERSCDDFVSERVIEGHSVDDVIVIIQREQLFSCHGVPDLASSVVGPRNELVATLVKCAISQGKQVSS